MTVTYETLEQALEATQEKLEQAIVKARNVDASDREAMERADYGNVEHF